MYAICLIGLLMMTTPSFKEAQLKHSRVKEAYDEKEEVVKRYFDNASLKYEGFYLLLRAFKMDEKLEVWVKEKGKETYALLHTYNFCSSSGTLGPKRKEEIFRSQKEFILLIILIRKVTSISPSVSTILMLQIRY